LQLQIERRKKQMDRQNIKSAKANSRTVNAKSLVFQTRDNQRFMIMNKTTMEKLDAPADHVLDFVKQQRTRVKRQAHLP